MVVKRGALIVGLVVLGLSQLQVVAANAAVPPGCGSFAADASATEAQAAAAHYTYSVVADYTHISTTQKEQNNVDAVQGHSWWEKNTGPASTAAVSVRLEYQGCDGKWHSAGSPSLQNVAESTKQTKHRVTATAVCSSTNAQYYWRSIASATVNAPGYAVDPAFTTTAGQLLSCKP